MSDRGSTILSDVKAAAEAVSRAPTKDAALETFSEFFYTTQEVAAMTGRTENSWCRVQPKYIAKYDLESVWIGRRKFYKKPPVDAMYRDLIKHGDNEKKRPGRKKKVAPAQGNSEDAR